MATLRQVLEDLGRLGKSPMVAAQARSTAAEWLRHEARDPGNAEQSGQFAAAAKVLHARALEDIEAAVTTQVDVYVGYGKRGRSITDDATAERIRTERARDEQDQVRRLREGAGKDAAEVPGHDAASLLEWAENRKIALLDGPIAVNPNTRGAVEHVANLRFSWHMGSAAGYGRGEVAAIKAADDRVAACLLRQADSAVTGHVAVERLRHPGGHRAVARGLGPEAPGLPGNPAAGRAGHASAEVKATGQPRGAGYEADKSAEF
ncbi:hypothetical protein [Yinghuangia aomiensis]|uniref:hypothetical protein n=1 Tax=Yinghuangia aomiensis TaxID=676205 RepID=UPI0031EC0ED0